MTPPLADPPKLGLVVEDNRDTRAWLIELLTRAFPGLRTASASDLAQARAWLEERGEDRSPAIAIIDLGLPDGSGVHFIRDLVDGGHAVSPVVVTIYDDDAHLFDAIAAGAQGYLLKEEEEAVLTARLRRIVEGEPPLSPSIARRILEHFHKKAPEPAKAASAEACALTPREREVLALLAKGFRVADVAGELGLTRHTVAGYVKVIYSKLNVSSRAEAALAAQKRGLA